jgi:hypothetical protein
MTFIPSVLSTIDNNNSTTSNLGPNGEYSGSSWSNTNGYNILSLSINSNQDSAIGGINISFANSNSGTGASNYYTETYYANSKYSKSFQIPAGNYRLTYTNGPTGTTDLNIVSRLETNSAGPVGSIDNLYSNTQDSMMDAFNKLRVSNPFTLIDVKVPGQTGGNDFVNSNLNLCYSSTGNYTNTPNLGFMTLSGTGVGKQINQTRKYNTYQPGKSTLVLLTGIIQPEVTDTPSQYIGRFGYFDSKNGLFFACDGNGDISVNVRNEGDLDISIPQSDWNVDKMNGNGNSGFNLDFSKTQLFVIDFEWLGIGRIRFGFYVYGKIYYCHQVNNINVLDKPYMKTANLPIRYELEGISGALGTASIRQICATSISEGGYNPIGHPFSFGLTGTISTNQTEFRPLFALSGLNRVSGQTGNYYHQNIIPTSFSIVDTSNNNASLIRARMFLSPTDLTLTNGSISWKQTSSYSIASIGTFSGVNTTINSPTTNFFNVYQDIVAGRSFVNLTDLTQVFNYFFHITSDINNNANILVFEALGLSANTSLYATLNWQEEY